MVSGFAFSGNGAAYPAQVHSVASPAAGQDWSFNVLNTGIVVAVEGVLVTSAVVASRVPRLRFTDPSGRFCADSPELSPITASSTARCVWILGGLATGLGGEDTSALPWGLVVTAGWTVLVATANIDNTPGTGDQWSQLVVTTSA